MVGKVHKSPGVLVLLLLSCTIIGSFLGDLLQPYLPGVLAESFKIGAGPFPVDLKVLSFSLGISIKMNIMSMVGLIAGLVIYKKGF